MTDQEIFDKVAAHLLKQGERSMTEIATETAPICAYRGDNGRMCAAGCLIPNAVYSPEMEGRRFESYALAPAHEALELTEWQKDLVRRLQIIHDLSQPVDWDLRLRELAGARGLDDSVIGLTLADL